MGVARSSSDLRDDLHDKVRARHEFQECPCERCAAITTGLALGLLRALVPDTLCGGDGTVSGTANEVGHRGLRWRYSRPHRVPGLWHLGGPRSGGQVAERIIAGQLPLTAALDAGRTLSRGPSRSKGD